MFKVIGLLCLLALSVVAAAPSSGLRNGAKSPVSLVSSTVAAKNPHDGVWEGKKDFPNFPNPIDEERKCTGYWAMGCYMDTSTHPRFWYNDHVDKLDRERMQPSVCYDFCKNITGVSFFGLLRGRECYCSPYITNVQGNGGDGMCTSPCEGDQSKTCGGMKKANVYQMHDCNNLPAVPCKSAPPAVPFAVHSNSPYYKMETPCKNLAKGGPLDTVHMDCLVDCVPGYWLSKNSLRCEEKGDRLTFSWAQIAGEAACTPVSCGTPPPVEHSRYARTEVFYPHDVEYTCQLGYSLDAQASGKKKFDIACQTDSSFPEAQTCKAVQCGKCPKSGAESKFSNSKVLGDSLKTYGDFCSFNCDQGYTLDSNAQGATNYKVQCSATGDYTEPDGCNAVQCGPPLQIPFASVEVEDKDAAIVFPNKAGYKCEEGYTIDAEPRGKTSFDIKCRWNGVFVDVHECKPVKCGKPPRVLNSLYAQDALVFSEKVMYTCKEGYSMTGKATGQVSSRLSCGHNGQYEGDIPVCKPVECGLPPTAANVATKVTGMIHFESRAVEYQCEPGYSTVVSDDPYTRESDKFAVSCLKNGEFAPMAPCVNINDCLAQNCGDNGVCEDEAKPTGKPVEDYNCKCNAGWEQSLMKSDTRDGDKKMCTNINDCPTENVCGGENEEGGKRGVCTDLLEAYTCICRPGYELTKLEGLPNNATCTPVSCGPAPVEEHTVAKSEGVQHFDNAPTKYECDEGYSTNAKFLPETAHAYERECKTTATWSPAQPCLAIVCGATTPVEFSTKSPALDSLVFPQTVNFACDEGYSTDAEAAGVATFDVECQKDGTLSKHEECKAVKCGNAPEHKDASWDKTRKFVFSQTTHIDCNDGFSLDATTSPAADGYTINCQADGKWSTLKECEPIKCGRPPVVANTDRPSAVVVFGGSVEFTLHEGWTVNGEATGASTFTIDCQADGTFTRTFEPKRVVCGEGPVHAHTVEAAVAEGPHKFEDKVQYQCDSGYSTSGNAEGPFRFRVECQADGKFTTPDHGCELIKCGTVTVPEHAEQFEGESSLKFGQKARFQCSPGYSFTGEMTRAAQKMSVACQADGIIETPPFICKNMNDCKDNKCGAHGTCKDHAEPTGVHNDDYHCECDSGFEEEIKDDGTHICGNVPDCPVGACSPGECKDLVNDYECVCPAGYYVGANPSEELAHDCLPVKCGAVPTVAHAATEESREWYFAMEPIGYNCATGYTLDGSAEGQTDFVVNCETSGSFSAPPVCKPVVCPTAPAVEHATFPAGPYHFPNPLTYTCGEGYTLSGEAASTATFNLDCKADGTFPLAQLCKANKCGTLGAQSNGVYDAVAATDMVYSNTVEVRCDAGYVLEGSSSMDSLIKAKSARTDATTSYTVTCAANGQFEGVQSCVPLNCGDAPVVGHAQGAPAGHTYFTSSLTYTAATGFAVGGSSEGPFTQSVRCKATGEFSSFAAFEPVSCGMMPSLPQCEELPVERAEHSPAAAFVQKPKATTKTLKITPAHAVKVEEKTTKRVLTAHRRAHRREEQLVFQDKAPYKCREGHAWDSNNDGEVRFSDETTFKATCSADGTLTGVKNCFPVLCTVTHPRSCDGATDVSESCSSDAESKKGAQTISEWCSTDSWAADNCGQWCCGEAPPSSAPLDSEQASSTFGAEVDFSCQSGFSLDGSPTGEVLYKEECTKDGTLSAEHLCKDIDWCQIGECGANGECQDEHMGYKCDCKPGYEQTLTFTGKNTCSNINECDSLAGTANCGAFGTCVDELEKYKCDCQAGYESKKNTADLDICSPKMCGTTPEVANANSPLAGQKVSFPNNASFTCAVGHSLDATAQGEISWLMSCENTGTFEEPKECKAVACSELPVVADSTKNATTSKFGEGLKYTCDKGRTITGMADGEKEFDVECFADGTMGTPTPCRKVKCGVPSLVMFSRYENRDYFFEDKADYVCQQGYSTTGTKEGPTTFSIDCKDDGLFTSGEKCLPITCGSPKEVQFAIAPMRVHVFPEAFSVFCDAGFTINSKATGQASFVVTCGDDGSYKGEETCKPVSCGEPKPTSNAVSTDGEKVYQEEATWECKAGFSVNGLPNGRTKFVKVCQGDGAFGDSAPSDCQDMNFCAGSPCGRNGVCTDKGLGLEGYTCQCTEGYEVKPNEAGKDTCSEDDCAGNPCGDGGSCLDLSKTGAPQGAYSCECVPGYSLHEPSAGEFTCRRNVCGALPPIDHMEKFEVETFSGGEAPIDALTGKPSLKSFDEASYFCDSGYSTDGGVGAESKQFTISCTEAGVWSRTIVAEAECQPVRCDNFQLPLVPNTVVVTTPEAFFEYGDTVNFRCSDGFSLTGDAVGDVLFSIGCLESGRFENPRTCHPINCGKPTSRSHTSRSTNADVHFPAAAQFMCDEGYTLTGEAAGAVSFGARCLPAGQFTLVDADGAATTEEEVICHPVACGAAPQKVRSSANAEGEYTYGQQVVYTCQHGYSRDGRAGGQTHFTSSCQSSGAWSNSDLDCQEVGVSVSGFLTDASTTRALGGASVTMTIGGYSRSTTSNSGGIYSMNMPPGNVQMRVTMNGYITATRVVAVSGPIAAGQGADLSLAAVMPEGDWKFVVSWGRVSRDLDSHLEFGSGGSSCHLYYGNRNIGYCAGTGGVSASLDADDVSGYGPETVTVRHVGHCTDKSKCLIKFKVKNYSTGSATLPASNAKVAVYRGSSKVWEGFPPVTSSTRIVTIGTIDATNNQWHAGEWAFPPWLHSGGTQNWWSAFDYGGWVHVPQTTFMTGMMKTNGQHVYNIEEATYARVGGVTGSWQCHQANWWGCLDNPNRCQCSSGYFLNGLYRTGGIWHGGKGTYQIEVGYCCKFSSMPSSWSNCLMVDGFHGGRHSASCPAGYAMAGIQRDGKRSNIEAMNRFLCCRVG